MPMKIIKNKFKEVLMVFVIMTCFTLGHAKANETYLATPGNFGLPGIIDLPTARHFPDGELVVTQQLHNSLARSGISFQALPRVGVSFRYSGHGTNGGEAYGRINHDRSFDAHISVLSEGKYLPAISIGLRDFIGTGWYSSEYLVGTKSLGSLEFTAGLGFGRLAGKNAGLNPFSVLSSRFDQRGGFKAGGKGGTLNINWFTGPASAFYGLNYRLGSKITISSEYSPDLMLLESSFIAMDSPWNFGAKYKVNKYFSLGAQYLYGSKLSFTAHIITNPSRPPMLGGKELAPVPMRLRGKGASPVNKTNKSIIRKVLDADRFKIHHMSISGDTIVLVVNNTKFRSTAQAVGRLASTLQRFAADDIKFANISFYSAGLQTGTYRVDLDNITWQQTNPVPYKDSQYSVKAIDQKSIPIIENEQRFTWGVGPYVAHRLFNPDLPLSMETGIEIQGGYQLFEGLKVSGSLRKSVLTNLTDNERRSNSDLPHVHSDWPLYDIAGQPGHIHALKLSYVRNLAPGFYGRVHMGLLEPFYAGIGGEVLYKPAQSPIGIGIDIHRVRKRDFDMRFDLLDFEMTIGHLSVYYDAGGMFDIEINAGRFLAGDDGATATISRKFGSGWEVGGYATLTDVPFEKFGEGSFDKAIYVSIPIDWIISSPNRTKRRLTLRPITRDGGAHLASARSLNRHIERSQSANFKREFGRLWK